VLNGGEEEAEQTVVMCDTERRKELGGALACWKELWRGAAATRKPKQLPQTPSKQPKSSRGSGCS
jgi:hypothetical protein